jgi:hypothetical protein
MRDSNRRPPACSIVPQPSTLPRAPNIYMTGTKTCTLFFLIWGWSPYWVHSALRLLLAYCTCPGWLWGWRIWWNEWFWHGKPKYWEKTFPDATLPIANLTCQTRPRTWAAAVGRQRLTASTMARATCTLHQIMFRRVKSLRMEWVGYIARIGQMRNI